MGVLVAGVCLRRTSGGIALAPQLGILGRRVHPVHGQRGPVVPAERAPLGTALLVSRQPRNRVGLGSPSRQHARHKFQRNVHRISRSIVDWCGVHGAFGAGPACKSGLFRETDRAWTWHGRFRDALRRAARAALSRSSGFSLQHRLLRPTYTMLAATWDCARGTRCVKLCFILLFVSAFEAV